jgi:hypothetical protein
MAIRELDQEHRVAIARYLRAEKELDVVSVQADPEAVRAATTKRDEALEQLNKIREEALIDA